MKKNNEEIKCEKFIKEFSELFNKYDLYYEVYYDTINIYDKKSDKKVITCFDMDDDDFSTSGFYINNDNSRTFISYEMEDK